MESREIVRRAIRFENPPRLPLFIGDFWGEKMLAKYPHLVNDVFDCWECDRQKAGWFFDAPAREGYIMDDWGCGWSKTEVENMGQVVFHPLQDWAKLDSYAPPNPTDPFYFERIDDILARAGDRYVVLTTHFNLIERLHMLHGFAETFEDLYLAPEKIEKVLDLILEWKVEFLNEAARRFGDRVHGWFLTDDWGSQNSTFISPKTFEDFFLKRYHVLSDTIHGHGWDFILHTDGKINAFMPFFEEMGVDVLNLQQPQTTGIREIGDPWAGKMCFLSTADVQATLPKQDPEMVVKETEQLVKFWSVPEGGLIVFNYGHSAGIGTTDEITELMFETFIELSDYWKTHNREDVLKEG
jgi:hypothetical protein